MANIPQVAKHLVTEYRRFLMTSYRFLDVALREQFEEHLAAAELVVKGPYVTLSRDFATGRALSDLVAAGEADGELLRARWAFGAGRLFQHQEQALAAGRAGQSFVVTTGTGSGKTEAFLLPALDGIVQRKRTGVRGVQAVLLYPMNALANDQLERLRRLLRETGLGISFGLYTGESDTSSRLLQEPPGEHERTTREAIRRDPPDVLLTNFKQLEFLLVRRDDRALFSPSLRYLVLDELHSYTGALATEIACLIRRLKAHARIEPGQLIAMGTSATVASDAASLQRLAEFATVLFGETVASANVFVESRVAPTLPVDPYVPAPPSLGEEDIASLDVTNAKAVAQLAERLAGRALQPGGELPERVATLFRGNQIVGLLREVFDQPSTVADAVKVLREKIPSRAMRSDDELRRETEAYLIVGSSGDEEHPPILRPKLHTFFHGIYDVALCLDPECRTLVPRGGARCTKCGSVAWPAALCRTCGQDFVKVRFEREGDQAPVGTADFYSDESTAYLTHAIHSLPTEGAEEEAGEGGEAEPARPQARRGRRKGAGPRLEPIGVCPGCGRLFPVGETCSQCDRPIATMHIVHGKLSKCPACLDINTRADIVTPLRTGTASSVSVLTTHHLDRLRGNDRRLLVFADNRQDAAHQAGYTADKHRTFALRHFVAREVHHAGAESVHLTQLPERIYDHYVSLGIIHRNAAKPERDKWKLALKYEVASEFTRYTRQRVALEYLGLAAVEYEFIERLAEDPGFQAAVRQAGLESEVGLRLARMTLDVMRKRRAVSFDFFQKYLDPDKAPYRELQEEPYNVRFPDRDRMPKAFALDRPDHIRKSGRLEGFFQENPRAGQLAAAQKVVDRLVHDRAAAEAFLRACVEALLRHDILVRVPHFPIPAAERTARLEPLQIRAEVIRLVEPDAGFRCNACQGWSPYTLPTCPTPKCSGGELLPAVRDPENYYVHLYADQEPQRLDVQEHTAQISGEDRADRETSFKKGKLDVMVCSPTLELGVDIGPLLSVLLRNAPPNPARYAQRVGRAGRRLRIGFVSTFCAGGAHDRYAFENPAWLVRGQFDAPRLRLDNPKIVRRHLRSHVLECLEEQLPGLMGDLLDDLRTPTRWMPEQVEPLMREVEARRDEIVGRIARLFAADRTAGRLERFGPEESAQVVDRFRQDLVEVFDAWEARVKQLDREFREFSTIGSPRTDTKKANARRRAYIEITNDRERAYVLNYLSTRGLLPAYQFPIDTFSLDPGVQDTPTLFRPAAIALEEFAPGNLVYANGRKLRSIRVLFASGADVRQGAGGRTDAETSGSLLPFHFCAHCDEVVEGIRNTCPRCGAGLPAAVDALFVQAFEAEESQRIGSGEESRERRYQRKRESLLLPAGTACEMYPYSFTPVEFVRLAEVLVTNWGRVDSKTGEGIRFWLCPDCGRHMPGDPARPEHAKMIRDWSDSHRRFCAGDPVSMVLAYKFPTDALVVTLPARADEEPHGSAIFSPTLVTMAEALRAGGSVLLELEPNEIQAFVRPALPGRQDDQVVLYETVPGGAGYLEEMARRLPDVAAKAMDRLYGHECTKACYLCLKHYGNQRWHEFFDKDRVRDLLWTMSQHESIAPVRGTVGLAGDEFAKMLAARKNEVETSIEPGPQPVRFRRGHIEEPLQQAMSEIADLPPGDRELEIQRDGVLLTVPDFAWPAVKLAVYCDGFAYHGNAAALALDADKRNHLQKQGWMVLVYWGRTILANPRRCAEEIASAYRGRRRMHA